MGSEILRVEGLSVAFPTEDGVVNAVRGLSYSLRAREVLSIVGESGSGKSVSSMAVMGLLPGSARISGSITFDGRELVGAPPAVVRKLRGNRISMIFQDPMTAMNPVYKVGDQLAEAYRSHHRVSQRVAWGKAVEALEIVGIPQPETRADSYPHEFSGGMRQRAMIAMAIINDPEVIFADEPTTALDVTVQAQILETLIEVKDRVNAAVVLITHDLGVVANMAQDVLVMYAGRAVETAGVDDLYANPRHPYTAGLLGSIPALEGSTGRLTPIKGAPPSLINLPSGCPFNPRCPLATQECLESEPDLLPTDRHDHASACYHWEQVAEVPDPRSLFADDAAGGEGDGR
jgi:peptide/nickel transport system ATP-binding protein